MRQRLGLVQGATRFADRVWKEGVQVPTPEHETGVRKRLDGAVLAFDRYGDWRPHGERVDVYCATAFTTGDDDA